jgi:hypothetical protein
VKNDCKSRLKLEALDALMQVSLCDLLMGNIDWARIFDSWKSIKNWRAFLLELMMIKSHYLNNFSASFYCMCFFNIVTRHVIFIFNTKWPISSFLVKCCKTSLSGV